MAERGPSGTIAYRAVVLAGGLLVLGLLFRQLLTLLLAVLITVIIAVALSAAAGVLERRFRIPRQVGAMLALLAGVGVIAGVIALVIPPFIEQTNDFVEDVPGIVDLLRERIRDLTGARPGEIADRVQGFAEGYTDDPGRLIGPITSIGLSVAGIFAALVLVLITAYYMAIDPDPLLDGVRRLVPPAHRHRADEIMSRLRSSWLGWMRGVAADMLVSGVLLYIGLIIIGLDFAIFFAVLTALLSVIPYFRRFRQRAPAGAVRVHRLARQGPAGTRHLHAGAAGGGQSRDPARHGPHREAAPGGDSRGGADRGPAVRLRGPGGGRADPLADRDPGRGAVGEADGGLRVHVGHQRDRKGVAAARA